MQECTNNIITKTTKNGPDSRQTLRWNCLEIMRLQKAFIIVQGQILHVHGKAHLLKLFMDNFVHFSYKMSMEKSYILLELSMENSYTFCL
jgi:hypothetical protein